MLAVELFTLFAGWIERIVKAKAMKFAISLEAFVSTISDDGMIFKSLRIKLRFEMYTIHLYWQSNTIQ